MVGVPLAVGAINDAPEVGGDRYPRAHRGV